MRTLPASPTMAARHPRPLSGFCRLLLALLLSAASLAAQEPVPGDYPHLFLSDGMGNTVPGPAGPFDNSQSFPIFAGQAFEARVSYASPGQPVTNVLWALLVSTAKTPLPTNVTPPPLLTMPPIVLLMGPQPTLDGTGSGVLPVFVPAGLASLPEAYLQALTWDPTGTPALRLSNGLALQVGVPGLQVGFTWTRAKQQSVEPDLLRAQGKISLGPAQLPQLKPLGPVTAPLATAGPDLVADNFRFLPIVNNRVDEPINPRARPLTRIVGSPSEVATTITVEDTSFFPRRGKLLIAHQNSNLWQKKAGGGFGVPPVEVVTYDGTTPTAFLNCQRKQLGSSGANIYLHVTGNRVVGEFTMATTSGAKSRSRISLDAENPDMPHLVIPAFDFDGGPGIGQQSMDLDLYLYETEVNKAQGFAVHDRVSRTWRTITDTDKNLLQGRWDPMICMAPDGRSFVAQLRVTGGALGWDYAINQLWAIRTDGLNWPASNSPAWQITFQVEADPTVATVSNARARRIWMPAVAIIGSDPENYVLYAGLAHKWKPSSSVIGVGTANIGQESEWIPEELLVRDLIECPLVPPLSTKAPPVMPRTWMQFSLPKTGFDSTIIRLDPEFLVSPDNEWLMLTGGGGTNAEREEDVILLRNVSVTAAGNVSKFQVNLSGYSGTFAGTGNPTNRRQLRAYFDGGRRAAISPGKTRVAWLSIYTWASVANDTRRDWLNIARTNGSSFGTVANVYETALGANAFKEGGALVTDRVINELRWLDEERLVFLMGRAPYDDQSTYTTANEPAMDLFLYDVISDVMTNLTRTDGSGSGFVNLGKIVPAALFASPNGSYSYLLRAGGISSAGNPPLPAGTPITNIVGIHHPTAAIFPVSGTEFAPGASVTNLLLPASELVAPVETPAVARFVEGSGVQEGLIWFTAHVVNGNGSDELFAFNRNEPFVAFQATESTKPGLHLTNIVPDPYGSHVAFARTDGTSKFAPTQHPFVVDLAGFMFERDLLPAWVAGNANIGRVMDGSLHFIPPLGDATGALVFSFGVDSLGASGIALQATPAYYALGTVSDPLAEPIPILIPLIDTGLLGSDYRFYITSAGPGTGP